MINKKKAADWTAIKADYLAATMSIREIAEQYCLTEGAIRKRAKAEKWPVRPKMVRRQLEQARKVRTAPPARPVGAESAPAAEPAAIADQARALVSRLLDELDTVTTHQGELEDMILSETAGDENNRRRDGMLGAISLGGRAKTLKELTAAFKQANEASAPQGKKAAQQEKANQIASRFRPIGPPKLKAVQ
ncbi:hypothetical protein [uncultured Sphingomonas sp.]|uniref:hypothetical protein n=1 Tax=uncultured Sphingomonas sp. TaxID=158754 RepID=UPI0025CD2DAD|nr:hypothetical protein [uncultured Sphingomonas sp.]